MIRNFINDFLKYLPTLVIPAIVGFIAIPVITRLFPAEDYGIYILVMATISILTTITGWLGMCIIRFYSAYEKDNKLGLFYNNIIKLLLLSIIAETIVFLIFLLLLKSKMSIELYQLMLIGTMFFILTAIFQVLLQFLRIKRQLGWYTSFSIWQSIAALGIGLALVMVFGYGVNGLLWGAVLSLVVALPLVWKMTVHGKVALRTEGISAALTKEMAKYGFPLMIANLAFWMLSLSDRYVLDLFRSAQEVGIYSASYALSEYSILLFTSLFALAGGPIIMNLWEKEGVEKSREFLNRLTRYYLLLCFPAAVGLSILAKPAIGILTPPQYYEGYRIVAFIACGVFMLGLQQRFLAGLLLYKKTAYTMTVIIISAILNLGLNFWLVPRFGYMAAAVNTLISYMLLLILTIVLSRRYFIWRFPFKTLGRVACASVIMGAIIYPVGNSLTPSPLFNLIAAICIGGLVYFTLLFLFREPQKEEIQELRNLRQKILGSIVK
jgi:O-antigen/teichoic acid export membrane protein